MWEQIRYNRIMTAVLVILMATLCLMIGLVLGILLAFPLRITFTESWPYGMLAASIIFIIMGLVAYLKGDDIILAISKARKIGEYDIQLHRLSNIIEEMRIASGFKTMPSMYMIDDPALNAFAVGCRPNKAAIIITSGLLSRLNRDELQGVIAHEMAHIKNRDVLLMTMCSMFLGAMVVLSPLNIWWNSLKKESPPLLHLWFGIVLFAASALYMAQWTFLIGTEYFRGVILISVLAWGPVYLLAILVFAQTVSSAISQRREYLADATAVLYTRYPEGLASALQKITASTYQVKSATAVTASLYITNPYRKKGKAASDASGTHPPISQRLRILRSLARVSYADYDRAYRKVRRTAKSVLPHYAISTAGTTAIRPPKPDDIDDIQRVRETSNAIWNLNKYKIIDCSCGTRIRVPREFKYSEVKCPHCGKVNTV